MLSVLGSRQMEEVNFLYFQNKSVPPLAILVSGGRLGESSVPRIERFVEENLKGTDNFHKLLIIEAEPASKASDTAKVKVELKPLTDAQLRFAEDQVFHPERDEFDYLMNRKLLADMGIRFWRFRSQTPITRDPERMTAMVEKLDHIDNDQSSRRDLSRSDNYQHRWTSSPVN